MHFQLNSIALISLSSTRPDTHLFLYFITTTELSKEKRSNQLISTPVFFIESTHLCGCVDVCMNENSIMSSQTVFRPITFTYLNIKYN